MVMLTALPMELVAMACCFVSVATGGAGSWALSVDTTFDAAAAKVASPAAGRTFWC